MANTPAASPTVSSTVGLKNMVIAPLEVDTEETLTYGDLQLVAGAIEASITPENADPDIQYADDIEFDVLYPDPELTFTTKMADIPLAIQEKIFGNQIDDNGVLIRSSTDKPPYFAVGFKSEKSNQKNRSLPRTTPPRRAPRSPARQAMWNGLPSSAPMTGATRLLPMRARTASRLRRVKPSCSPCIRL